jgi:hypothetical protein
MPFKKCDRHMDRLCGVVFHSKEKKD